LSERIVVIKRNLAGIETWRYPGRVLERRPNAILIEAFFDRSAMPLGDIWLQPGDRFLEIYFSDRWYNVFEIYPGQGARPKAWYGNITRPAEFAPGQIAYVDLALDLLAYPDGRIQVLDEDEFAALTLSEDERQRARAALDELHMLLAGGRAQRQPGLRWLLNSHAQHSVV